MPKPIIYVVDDDEGMRESLMSLLESYGWTVIAYASAENFLRAGRPDGPACLILDIRMPGFDGFDLQSELKRLNENHSIIFLTGHGTIPLSVKAMREGAVEFLTKPFTESELVAAVELASKAEAARWAENEEVHSLRARYKTLTEREKEVFAFVVSGRMNKVIASDLGIAEITVKVHRARAMEKLGTRTLADLVRIASQLDIAMPKS
jgi:FixJ family two-component response regulator